MASHPPEKTLLRGRTLSFERAPESVTDTQAYHYIEDGGILMQDGLIVAVDRFETLSRSHPDATVVDHQPHLLMPGFIDTHLHFPQLQVIGSWAEQLLDWLNDYTFPAEAAFAAPAPATNSRRILQRA